MTAHLRRGFKTEAERISTVVRADLNLTAHDRLDCLKLAEHLEVPVLSVRELQTDGARPESIRRLMSPQAGFSALTVCAGTRRLIIYNPQHAIGRRANSLAHELSHIILKHPASPPVGTGGCRHWDPLLEAEADWLAGALLVPREGALARLRRGNDLKSAAEHFGVSLALFRWRVNQTGVIRQLDALLRRKARRHM